MKELFYNEMWSNNKKISLAINILLFLVAVNFWYVGQIFVPIECLLIFISNRFKFKVNNIYVFIILCLFGISFCAFSYKLGIYCVAGLFVPMAYYIGSNIDLNFENKKKLIYIIAFGLATHMILCMFLEISFWYDNLSYMFNKPSHYDFWLYIRNIINGVEEPRAKCRINTTNMSLNYVLLCSCVYYLFAYEKNVKTKVLGLIIFALSSIYILALGRRASVIILMISILIPILLNIVKNKKIETKKLLILLAIILVIVLVYALNIFGIKDIIDNLSIVQRIKEKGFFTDRIVILQRSIKYYPKYLWGGQKISSIVEFTVHDIWGDIYDYAGIIPYLLFIAYSIYCLVSTIKTVRSNPTKNNALYLTVFVCTTACLFIEPIMTGNSIYLITVVIVLTAIQKESY